MLQVEMHCHLNLHLTYSNVFMSEWNYYNSSCIVESAGNCSMQGHYCVAIGVKDKQGILENVGFQQFVRAPPSRPCWMLQSN